MTGEKIAEGGCVTAFEAGMKKGGHDEMMEGGEEGDEVLEDDIMNALPIEDMSKTYIEHSMVIDNFVIKIGSQMKDSLCRVFSDGVQYQWKENDDKTIIPDASIVCNIRDRTNVSLTGIPRFVMEVLSDATESYDRNEKMDIYRKVGVSEYWIVDWRKKQVEIYMFDFKEDDTSYAYLFKKVTEKNKEELQLVMFPNLQISFDELFQLNGE